MGKSLSRSELQRRVAELEQENALLRQKIDALARRIFGKSSEALSSDQLELLLGLATENETSKADASWPAQEAESPRSASRPRRSPKERWPENLPVIEEVIDPEEVKASPQNYRHIGEEVTEQLDYEPARFLRRRLIRNKYVPRFGVDVVPVIAVLPPMLQERCTAAPGLLAAIIVGKFCDHLPLYRQEAIFASRHDIELPRHSQARWLGLAADWLRPIYDLIRTEVLSDGYVQVDETPIRYLDPGNQSTRLGYLWTTCRPRGDVVFRWETSRSARCLENIIPANFEGTIQCDAYAAYPSFARARERALTLAGCWAHVRRKFFDARELAPQQAGFILRQIGQLYRLEARLRRTDASPKMRAHARSVESLPILARIRSAMRRWKMTRRFLPKSTMGMAVDYALANWPMLEIYLRDGRIEIDNNTIENSIRPTAIGKKNWLFIGGAHTGQRSAVLYTIIESCRRRGINPFDYLRDVLTRLPSTTNWHLNELTPAAWSESRLVDRVKLAA